MRHLHWKKIANAVFASECLWSMVDPDKVQLDVESFTNTFKEPERKKNVAPAKAGVEKKKKELVYIIDKKKSFNLDIFLTRIHSSPEDIRTCLLELDLAHDHHLLAEDTIEAMFNLAPTTEEVKMVIDYKGDTELLNLSEKFILTISDVPRVDKRWQGLLLREQFAGLINDIREPLQVVCSALTEIRSSLRLRQVFEILLRFGNTLNNGTRDGDAMGFKIQSLETIRGCNSTDNKGTLLLYAVSFCATNYPESYGFREDLKSVKPASRYEQAQLVAKLGPISLRD